MATNRKTILTLIAVMACAVLLMSGAFATSGDWETPGNTDLNIQNGGTMLLTDDTFYYSEHGIYAETTARRPYAHSGGRGEPESSGWRSVLYAVRWTGAPVCL